MMSPDRLRSMIWLTLLACDFSPPMRLQLVVSALAQLHARWPLAGCSVSHSARLPCVIAVGRN